MINLSITNNSDILKKIKALSKTRKIVSKKELFSLCKNTNDLLEHEITFYRKCISIADNIPGGLIDFCGAVESDVIVVPDIHARNDFIYQLLSYNLSKEDSYTVFEKLCDGKLRMIFAGDILHSESPKKDRWIDSYEEYQKGNILSEPMTEEMTQGLSAMCQIMILKNAFPEYVHCLKGNHENILNSQQNGNHAFHKFVREGEMVLKFMIEKYGQELTSEIAKFELLLPVACSFDRFIISHAEPVKAYSRDEVTDSVINTEVVEGLTWTANDEAQNKSAEKMAKNFGCKNSKVKYITGHRPVRGRFNLRQDGKLVQIHNPLRKQFVYIKAGDYFEPERDIIVLE